MCVCVCVCRQSASHVFLLFPYPKKQQPRAGVRLRDGVSFCISLSLSLSLSLSFSCAPCMYQRSSAKRTELFPLLSSPLLSRGACALSSPVQSSRAGAVLRRYQCSYVYTHLSDSHVSLVSTRRASIAFPGLEALSFPSRSPAPVFVGLCSAHFGYDDLFGCFLERETRFERLVSKRLQS